MAMRASPAQRLETPSTVTPNPRPAQKTVWANPHETLSRMDQSYASPGLLFNNQTEPLPRAFNVLTRRELANILGIRRSPV